MYLYGFYIDIWDHHLQNHRFCIFRGNFSHLELTKLIYEAIINMDDESTEDGSDEYQETSCAIDARLLPNKAYYFFFFGSIGSFYPYLGQYFKQAGFTAPQIGILIGLRCFVQSIGLPFWGVLADWNRFSMKHIFHIGLLGWLITNAAIYSISAQRASCLLSNDTILNTSTSQDFTFNRITPAAVQHNHLFNTSKDFSDIENEILQGENDRIYLGNTKEKRLALLQKSANIRTNDRGISSNFSYFSHALLSQVLEDDSSDKTQLNHNLVGSSLKQDIEGTNTTKNQSFPGLQENNVRQSNKNIFLSLVIVIVIGHLISAPAQTFANIATLQKLGKDSNKYGTQRAFGAVGWGILSFLTGIFLELFSRNYYCHNTGKGKHTAGSYTTDYTPIFIAFQGSISVAFFVSFLIDFQSESVKEPNINEEDEKHLSYDQQIITIPTVVVLLTAIICGLNNGFIDSFLAWHLANLDGTTLLFSIMFAMETIGETLGFLGSDKLLQYCAPSTGICLGLVSYVIRLGCYGLVANPWIALSVEVLKAFTTAILWSSLVAYVGLRENCAATFQSVLHGAYWGLGNGAGGIFGGFLVARYGAANTFLGLSGLSLLQLFVFALVHFLYQGCGKERRGGYSILSSYE